MRGTEVFSTGDGRYYTSRIEADGPHVRSQPTPASSTSPSRSSSSATRSTAAASSCSSRAGSAGTSATFYTIHYETPPFKVDRQQYSSA